VRWSASKPQALALDPHLGVGYNAADGDAVAEHAVQADGVPKPQDGDDHRHHALHVAQDLQEGHQHIGMVVVAPRSYLLAAALLTAMPMSGLRMVRASCLLVARSNIRSRDAIWPVKWNSSR